jgi:hypothetical protein
MRAAGSCFSADREPGLSRSAVPACDSDDIAADRKLYILRTPNPLNRAFNRASAEG